MISTTIIYSLTFAISIFCCYVYEKNHEENSKIKNYLLILGGTIPLIFISAIRYKVGIDYEAYIINFKNIMVYFDIPYLFKFYSKEPLYVLVTYIGGIIDFFNNGLGMFFVYACIFVGFTFAGILRFKDKISIPLAMFIFCLTYYLVSYNSVRQMIAVAIVFWNFKNILDKKPIKYILFTIVAGMFHKTAYAMILLYFLRIKVDSKKINRIFYILIILTPFLMPLIYKLLVFLANTFNIYSSYTKLETTSSYNFLLYIIPNLIILTFHRKKILKIDSRNEILYRILYLQIPVQFLGNYISYSDRMALYLGFFQILAIPLILKTDFNLEYDENNEKLPEKKQNRFITFFNKYNNKKNWSIIIIGWYIFYFTIMYIVLNSNGVYPYQTIFKNIANIKIR